MALHSPRALLTVVKYGDPDDEPAHQTAMGSAPLQRIVFYIPLSDYYPFSVRFFYLNFLLD